MIASVGIVKIAKKIYLQCCDAADNNHLYPCKVLSQTINTNVIVNVINVVIDIKEVLYCPSAFNHL